MGRKKISKKMKKLLFAVGLLFLFMTVTKADVYADTVTMTIERLVLGKGYIMEPEIVAMNPGETYADLVQRVLQQKELSYDSTNGVYGFYLAGIKNADVGKAIPSCVLNILSESEIDLSDNRYAPNLQEFSYTQYSGWMYYVNNQYMNGMSLEYPQDGDVIRLMFTLCYGADLTGTTNPDLTGEEAKTYYQTADKSDLIRILGRINADQARWESEEDFTAAYGCAMQCVSQVDANQNEVDEAFLWLSGIEETLAPVEEPEPVIEATGITLDHDAITFSIDDKQQALTYSLIPGNAAAEVSWYADDKNVADVDENGTVTAAAPGETDIHAVTANGHEAICHITITESEKPAFLSGMPNVKAQAVSYNSVKISWDAYKHAEKYIVSRRESGSTSWTSLAEVTNLSYTDKTAEPGIQYYYTVKAASSRWGSIVNSKFAANVTAKTTLGKTTISKTESVDYNKIKVTWSKTAGASGYTVYRATSSGGSYKAVAQITKGTVTSYTSGSNLTTGTTYYYKINAYRMVNSKKVYGTASAVKSVKPALKKTTLKAAAKSKKVSLTWNKINGASGYVIYRSTSKNGSYKAIKTIKKGSTVSYTQTKLSKGKTYYYKVRAYRTVNKKKVYGAYSDSKSAKVK